MSKNGCLWCRTGGVSLISWHATDHKILLISARHFLQRFNVEGSKGHIICGCARDYGRLCCFSLILCLFKTLFEREAICLVLYSSPNAVLFCECVSSDKKLKLGYYHDDVRRLGLFQDTNGYRSWNWRRVSQLI